VVTLGVPAAALWLQSFLPLHFMFFRMFDLPLLVTIFFSMARRNPIAGLLTGSVIGLFQDALTGLPLGVNGIAKTVVGYGASSLGVKLDIENAGARLLVTLAFYVIHQIVYFTVARGMVALNQQWSWPHELWAALANAVVGVLIFFALDRFKQRT
jgi:rod shape-determining protein MreD